MPATASASPAGTASRHQPFKSFAQAPCGSHRPKPVHQRWLRQLQHQPPITTVCSSSSSSGSSSTTAVAATAKDTVSIHFRKEGVTVEAKPGEDFMEAVLSCLGKALAAAQPKITLPASHRLPHLQQAVRCLQTLMPAAAQFQHVFSLQKVISRANADVATGCLSGSCGICEVELHKYNEDGTAGSPIVLRACVARVPKGFPRLEVAPMPDDLAWGQDGWDT